MEFPQASIFFRSSFTTTFLNDLETVPYTEKNPQPSPYNLYPVFESKGKVPDPGSLVAGLVFIGIYVVFGFLISLLAWNQSDSPAPWVIYIAVGGLVIFQATRVAKWRRFAHRMSVAWANGWIDCYPVLIGSLYHEHEESDTDKKSYSYRTDLLVVAPNGDTRVLRGFEFEAVSPSVLETQGLSWAGTAADISLGSDASNGWSFLAVVRGKPLTHGTLEHGLTRPQVAAGLDRVQYGWPLDMFGPLPGGA